MSDTSVLGTCSPSIYAYFSEPADPATAKSQSLFVADASGRHSAGYTVCDVGAFAARFVPQKFQKGAPYTATVTTAVPDTSGNALAADYLWSFTTEAGPAGGGLYLPLVVRRR